MAKDAKISIINIGITGTNNSDHRKIDNTNSGHRNPKIQKSHCRKNRTTTFLHR